MNSSPAAPVERRPWPMLWATSLVSLLAQLALCRFLTFGQSVAYSIDVNPCNIWKYGYHFPPRGEFLVLNWFGLANLPPPLNPFTFAAAHFPAWLFFSAYAPLAGTAALFAMVAFLRELELPRPAALFGGVAYAWQGDLLPFVFPGHYGYITTWAFFALAAWAALRAQRHWAYALIAGASCGLMIGLQPDRGCMISLLIAVLYLAPVWRAGAGWWTRLKPLFLCGMTALLVSAAAFLGLFQSYIFGVTLGAAASREQAFDLATQFSLGPAETLSYLVPGFFGWYNGSASGPYWGWIGQTPGWAATHHGVRNLNLAISTTGTAASLLALLGALALFLPARKAGEKGRGPFNDRLLGAGADFSTRQLFFGRVLLIVGGISLLLAWGYHTPFYRPLFALPLMDKWRNPLKWLEGFNFAIPVLAAFGLAHLIRSLREPSLRFFIGIFLAVVNGALILVLAATYPIAVMLAGSLQDGGGYTPTGIANAMQTLHAAAGVAVAVGLAFGLIVAGVWRGDRLQAWRMVNPLLQNLWQRALSPAHRAAFLGSLLGLLAMVQLGWVAAHFIDAVDLAHVTSDNPLLVALQAEGPQVRVAVPQPQDPLLNFFLQNQFAQDRISSIDISAASRIPEALVHFVDAFIGNPSRLWLIGGVKDVAIGEADLASLRQNAGIAANIAGADGYTLAPTGNADLPSHAIVRLRDYLAKATFFPRAEIMAKDDALLKRLNDPAWNPRAGVLLAGTGPGAAGKDDLFADSTPTRPPAAATSVNVTTYSPHRIALQLDAPSAGYVFINDAYDPDWRVEINGRPARLLRADYLLRAVAVPAGHDEVTLRYELHYRFAGFALPAIVVNDFSDGAMLLAWGVAGVALWRQRKSGRAAASARR